MWAIDSNVTDRAPQRFRRRLTAAFVIVATISAGVVAILTFFLTSEHRWRNFRNTSLREARITLAFAPRDLDADSFGQLRDAFMQRTGAHMIAVQGGETYTSSPGIGLAGVPASLRTGSDEPRVEETRADGRPSLLVAADGPVGSRYYFFFSLEQLYQSLDELRRVAAAGWVLTVLIAGAVGDIVARRTLRPVAAAARAAEAIAVGDFGTRVPAASRDEFGALASSFNHMADEVQDLIAQLHESAARERRFTADVAHELRTPLTGISASASVLGEQLDELPVSLRRPAAVLVADVHRLRNLVLELLELSALDRGNEPVTPESLRIADAVAAIVESADLRRHARVEVAVAADIAVLAEPHRLGRILGNLIDNAVVHGAEPVRVSATRSGGDVLVHVTDQGPGVTRGEEERVFDRFFKSDVSRAATGSGLGLSIARQHAVALHGDLYLDTTPDGGTRFTVRLPAAPAGAQVDPELQPTSGT